MTPRILHPDGWADTAPGGEIPLDDAARHHLGTVLRRRPGDPIVLFDGEGRSIPAVLDEAGASRPGGRSRTRDLVARLDGPEAFEPAPALPIRLVQGISANERMDWTLEKAVEIGVDSVVPLQTRRGTARAPDERRLAHWRRIIASACAQAGRARLPRLAAPATAATWLADHRLGAGEVGLLLAPDADLSLSDLLDRSPAPAAVTLGCGPEAGFDPTETQSFVKAGWQPVRLGPRTLRTESAALVAMAIIQSRWGDLR